MSDLEPSEIELRRAARERALELLYEAEVKDTDVEALLEALPLEPAPLATELVRGVAANRERIDELLTERVAPRWSMARLATVDRAILRLAVYELLGEPERSQAVILNEAVVLARRFGTEDSPRFVNGVLSAVAAAVRPEGFDPGPSHADVDVDHAESEGPDHPADHDNPSGTASSNGATAQPRVDGLVMDLDGVIRHWDEASLPAAERELGLPAGAIGLAAFDADRLGRAMRGELAAPDWAAEIGAAVAAEHPVDAEAVAAAFTAVGWRIDESVVELVGQARGHVPVALLSNASSRLADDLRLSGIFDCFDAVVGSAEIGVCKPDRVAFRTAAARLGVAPERCLVVDDTAANVAAAKALGMRATRFASVDDLADELAAVGLLDSAETG